MEQHTSQPPLPVLWCQTCLGNGVVSTTQTCKICHGMGLGVLIGDIWYYLGFPLTLYHIKLGRAKRLVRLLEIGVSFALTVIFFLLAVHVFFKAGGTWETIFGNTFLKSSIRSIPLFLSGAAFAFAFGIAGIARKTSLPFRPLRTNKIDHRSEELRLGAVFVPDWVTARKTPRRKRQQIAVSFSEPLKETLERAYLLAHSRHDAEVTPSHLLLALLQSPNIMPVVVRLGVPLRAYESVLLQKQESQPGRSPVVSLETSTLFFEAFLDALEHHRPRVTEVDLLLATVLHTPSLEEALFSVGIDKNMMRRVLSWVRVEEQLRESNARLRHAASLVSKHGMDRAMTAIATPYLNAVSTDLTLLEKYGRLPAVVGREKTFEEIYRLIESGQNHILFSGENGVGKMSLIQGLAARMIDGDVPQALKDKRLLLLSVPALLSGTTMTGAIERLRGVLTEAVRSGNIILAIDGIHDLMGDSGQGGSLDVSEALSEFLTAHRLPLFATTTTEGYTQHIVRSQLGTSVAHIPIVPMDDEEAMEVLETHVGHVEYKNGVLFSYQALSTVSLLAKRFFHDIPLPESAVQLLEETAAYVRRTRGKGVLVQVGDVATLVHEKTGIPVETVTAKESAKLMTLETAMHQDVIGQDEAVSLVAAALRRARADLHLGHRPIATLLFLGPTGVGKTELAKTIARVYFGGEERMVRFDMSEFQDSTSMSRLIGEPGKQGTGLLTEAVRSKPFCLLLLDELEKADKGVLNLFLQVFDDGRLTDSIGRVIDFTNTIIIATSNAGTAYATEALKCGESVDAVRDALIHRELASVYRPEFLNRFDGIVLFRALTFEDAEKITVLLLRPIEKTLRDRGIRFETTKEGIRLLAQAGFDPVFGARPIRRIIQDRVENTLAELLLTSAVSRNDTIVLKEDGKLMVRSRETSSIVS